ncbi:uncharacterized protein LOC127280786 [Leptopilina boulardi]|uniref:uncharacterized protein LOC127280786 n=1 Tax=Leptopilina boulardi TaxID=63433 RepID=UPI0021F63142|nr:uncharacterized protein LOC127280786 [Leptopilina boulardi]
MKTILKKVLGRACLFYESLTTALCDAKAIINWRPLTYVSDDANDLKTLSPSMFLQETREIGVPDLDVLSKEKLNKKLRHRQQTLKDLRERFRVEYLSQLLLRGGKKETRKIKTGDVVLIGSDNQKRMDWPLGRIDEIIEGRDGQVRVCLIKTKNGLFKRPVQRIYSLELSASDEFVRDLNECVPLIERMDNLLEAKENSNKSIESVNLNDDHSGLDKIVTTKSGRISKKPERLKY